MNDFEIVLPIDQMTTIDVTDKNLYNYDFSSFSLAPLQETAGIFLNNNIKQSIFRNISEAKLMSELIGNRKIEYVANLSDYTKEKLKTGEWEFGIRKKTGETYAVIKDAVTGKNQNFVTLDQRTVQGLGNLPELSAIQGQLAVITEKIEDLNKLVERVEQGQYNDRYAGFFSARQFTIEGLSAKNDKLRQELLIEAIKISNSTIAKLMFSIHLDANSFIDLKTKTKEAKRIENILQNSIGYLNSAVQLNLIAYTALGEENSLLATLANYQSFIEQILLKEIDNSGRSIAWLMDNAHKGYDGRFNEISLDITNKITDLIRGIKNNQIEGESHE
ncbi:hypothetical protein [Candidatus Enterococcus ikei]|uniref:Uncharacterized protein n=1 Tax=Candidatus Enterococcus ikei TaxID=2815326 RepID=A0ABS3GUS6_9ENTE|nr:hypothetical protein [Enterococcus sp. DIV0869a]MBO0439006.1 hypothetical protein [Enterococcus sp. DIV0869a]